MLRSRSKLTVALALLLVVLIIGVTGFKVFMGLGWIDSLYMTVITITTVGYREVEVPDGIGKLFIIFLILASVVIVGYAVSVITEYLIARSSLSELRQRNKQKKIDAMEDHIIVCGYGRNGKQAVETLRDFDRDFVIIEIDQEVIQNSTLEEDHFVHGNANEDEVLLRAGVDRAHTLIAALPQDADNLFIVLSARQLNKDLQIISRASEETSYRKLKLAGADNVILPDKIGGEHMASLIVSPDLLEFWDQLSYHGNQGVNLEQISYDKIVKDDRKCSIIDLDIRKETGCNIIGLKKSGGDYIVNPEASTHLEPGSRLIVLGNSKQINKLRKLYHLSD